MNSTLLEGSRLIQSLGWTLVNSFWQGFVISAGLWIILRTFGSTQARLRYQISLSAMLLMFCWFILTWVQQWRRLITLLAPSSDRAVDFSGQLIHIDTSMLDQNTVHDWIYRIVPHLENLFPWLAIIYAIGILVMIVRFSLGLSEVYQLKNLNKSDPDVLLAQLFGDLKKRVGVAGSIRLYLSEKLHTPIVFGLIRPVILLPFNITTGLSNNEIEAILLHELAHIKRNDYLVNVLQTIIETVLFFNPFLWWISAGIRKEREHCCDDLVLAETLQPLPYATALATLAAFRNAEQQLALSAAGNNKHHLFNRIKRFTEMKKTPLNYSKIAGGIVSIGIFAGAAIWFTPTLGQDRKPKEASSSTKVQKIIVVDDQGNKQEYKNFEALAEHEKSKVGEAKSKEASVENGGHRTDRALPIIEDEADETAAIEHIETIVKNAIKTADWKAINQTTNNALAIASKEMKDLDWGKIDAEMANAMKELDKVDWDAAAAASKEGKSSVAIREEIRSQIKEAKEMARKAMDDARMAQVEARELSHSKIAPPSPPAIPARVRAVMPPQPPMPPHPAPKYDEMLAQMERDGLIDREEGFDISKNSKDLIVNGKEQPNEVKVKYRKFFSPGKVHIKGTMHNLSISTINDH